MAKKKEVDIEQIENLTPEEMEKKFSDDKMEKLEKKIAVKSKKSFSLDDYKKEKNADGAKFKPQTWIKMSEAFQGVTGLPGLAESAVIVVFGASDSGKTTMLLEAAKYAQEQGIMPVFVITEKKWSWERAAEMGIDIDKCIFRDDIDFIEEGCDFIEDLLRDQEEGKLPYDLLFLWDSIGATPSKREFDAAEEGEGGGGMMVTARVLRERITRRISHKINSTRKETHPYNSTLFIVNHAYQAPPSFPGGQTTLKMYGGDGIYLSASLAFRMGGVMTRSSKVKATKDGSQVAFGIKSALVVEKNHVTNVAPDGKIICTPHGFIEDTKEALDEYKKKYKEGWNLEFDKYWDKVTKD
jgi:RecA/RadA recombinase